MWDWPLAPPGRRPIPAGARPALRKTARAGRRAGYCFRIANNGGDGDDLLMSAYLLQGATPIGDPQDGRLAYDHAVGDDVADRLEGGGGDDTILFDRNDSVTGGSGADDFRLTLHDLVSAPDSGGGVAEISDFDRSEDMLVIFVDDVATSALTVINGASGSTVLVNGAPVLDVAGVSDLTLADLTLSGGGPLAEDTAIPL